MKPTDVALNYLGGLRKALAQKNTAKLKSSKMATEEAPAPMDEGADGMDESDLASILEESAPGDGALDESSQSGEYEIPAAAMDQATEGDDPVDPRLKKKHLSLTKG